MFPTFHQASTMSGLVLLFAAIAPCLDAATFTDKIVLENFADNRPTHIWTTMNDPIMGGQSESSLEITNGMARFKGHCSVVPSLRAPGFVTMTTGGFPRHKSPEIFPDISTCQAFSIKLRSSLPKYSGYYMSFGTVHLPDSGHTMGYKTHLRTENLSPTIFSPMILPFTSFSSKWDEATGKITELCSAENPQYCPNEEALRDLQTISFWGEGEEGDVFLEIASISAIGCTSQQPQPAAINDQKGSWGLGFIGFVFVFLLTVLVVVALTYYHKRIGLAFHWPPSRGVSRRTSYSETKRLRPTRGVNRSRSNSFEEIEINTDV